VFHVDVCAIYRYTVTELGEIVVCKIHVAVALNHPLDITHWISPIGYHPLDITHCISPIGLITHWISAEVNMCIVHRDIVNKQDVRQNQWQYIKLVIV